MSESLPRTSNQAIHMIASIGLSKAAIKDRALAINAVRAPFWSWDKALPQTSMSRKMLSTSELWGLEGGLVASIG